MFDNSLDMAKPTTPAPITTVSTLEICHLVLYLDYFIKKTKY